MIWFALLKSLVQFKRRIVDAITQEQISPFTRFELYGAT